LARAHDNFASHDEIRSVDYVDGMCCLFKTSVLRQVGLFDEQFFFDYEIIDLANRIRSGGWSIVYYPRTSVIHLKHASRRGVRWIVIETTRSELTYYAKYYPSQVAALQSITTTVVELRMVLNRVAQWFSPNEERATEYDLLRRVLEVVEAFRASAVNGNERIPRFERLGERRLDLAEPCDKA
jgi:GT2 family glycosyltransferase